MRNGPRSEPNAHTRAIATVLLAKLERSPLRTRHALAEKVRGKISRSQVYAILAGATVIDMAELLSICEAIGVSAAEVFEDAGIVEGRSQDDVG